MRDRGLNGWGVKHDTLIKIPTFYFQLIDKLEYFYQQIIKLLIQYYAPLNLALLKHKGHFRRKYLMAKWILTNQYFVMNVNIFYHNNNH